MGKATAGRKRRPGARTKKGRLSRGSENYDRGNDRAQAMQALYGTDGTDSIGRAYRSGLLGEGSEAKALLDLARRIAKYYWRAFETGAIRSAIGDKTGGSVAEIDSAKAKRQEQWLTDCLVFVDHMGANVRRSFNQLVIDVNPDHGPSWLDRLCFASRTPETADPVDEKRLREALDALEALAA